MMLFTRKKSLQLIPELPVNSALDSVCAQPQVHVAVTAKHGIVLHTATHLSLPDHNVTLYCTQQHIFHFLIIM